MAIISKRVKSVSLIFPALVVTIIVLMLPLALMARYSFNAFVPGQFMVEAFTLRNYVDIVTKPYYSKVLITTVLMAFSCTACCLLLGLPIAQFIARVRQRYKEVLILLIIIPLFIGNAVRAAGWMVAFGHHGLLNTTLMSLGVIHTPITIMYTNWATFFGIISINLCFVTLTLETSFESLDRRVEEAARTLGASPIQTWIKITIPRARPGIAVASILSFILAMNAYATPLLLGGPRHPMMGNVVANEIIQQNNFPAGSAISFALIITTVIVVVLLYFYFKKEYVSS